MGPENRELTIYCQLLLVCRSSGRLIIGLGPEALDVGARSLTVKVGVMVTLVTGLGSGLALQAKMLESKYK